MGIVYSNIKALRFPEKLLSLPDSSDRILPPIHVRLKPTNVCGHSCSYCAYKAPDLQLGKDMVERDSIPREKILEIIDDFSEMGVKAVTFSGGGDPFYYPHLLDAVTRLHEYGISVAALTNGSRLSNELAEAFARKATWLRISIDGWDDASYSEYRKVGLGEFSRVIENIRAFKKLGGSCYLGVSIIVDKNNVGHIYDLVSLLRDMGADSVKISPCIVSNNSAENNGYHKPIFDTAKLQTLRAKEKLENGSFEIFDSYHLLDGKFDKDYTWCPYIQILPVIGADQNVYSCQDKAYNLECGLIGSIKEQSFMDFWFSGKTKFFKIDPSAHCSHHCVANAKNMLVHDYLALDDDHADFV